MRNLLPVGLLPFIASVSSKFRKRIERTALAILLASLLTLPVRAQVPHYLQAGQPDPIALLTPPPEASSVEQAADLTTVIAVYHGRTTNDQALAEAETTLSVFAFARAIGPFFRAENLPRTDAFFKEVLDETKAVVDVAKIHWKRPRPYVVEPSLLHEGAEKTYSYPSGHSTRGTVFALVLAELFPDKRAEILAVGREIGWHRVQMAHHYPTDVHAGRVLGQAIFRQLKQNPTFAHDLAEVKAELSKAQQLPEAQATK